MFTTMIKTLLIDFGKTNTAGEALLRILVIVGAVLLVTTTIPVPSSMRLLYVTIHHHIREEFV